MGLLEYLKIFKKLSPGEKQAYLSRIPAEHQEQLSEVMDDGQAEAMRVQLEQALVDLKLSQKQQEEKANNTRRNKRA